MYGVGAEESHQMSSSGPSSVMFCDSNGKSHHMPGSWQVCIEGSSPTEGPKTSVTLWGGLARMLFYIRMCL